MPEARGTQAWGREACLPGGPLGPHCSKDQRHWDLDSGVVRLCSLMGGPGVQRLKSLDRRPQEPCHVNPVVYAAPRTLGAIASP